MQTIYPILRHADARAAIAYLCATFGLLELFSLPEVGELVRHALCASAAPGPALPDYSFQGS
jgi:uncharacterized glyoxalase superfamily protein PhnB